MKLHEIVTHNEQGHQILVEKLLPYRKSLRVLFPDSILMVTAVMNAAQYAKIVPAAEFSEALEEYVNEFEDMTDEDKEHERELIAFQSLPLTDL